jgi:hypothetical protein
MLQPLARLWGRLTSGLTPWRRRARRLAFPRSRTRIVWSERWQSPLDRLGRLAAALRVGGAAARPGDSHDRWDLEVRTGALGGARLLLGVEEHGQGCQLLRYRIWPRWSAGGLALAAVLGVLAGFAAERKSPATVAILAALAGLVLLLVVRDCAGALGLCLRVLASEAASEEPSLEEELYAEIGRRRPSEVAVEALRMSK